MDLRRALLVCFLCAAVLATFPAAASAKVVWLCHPAQESSPCEPSLNTTRYAPDGERLGTQRVRRARRTRVDCFYVYPTVSDQKRAQATKVVDDVLRSIALYQAARFSSECRVFAPVYRQATIQGLLDPSSVTAEMREEGYADVREAWRAYLRGPGRGRGVVVIGHSQGTFVLRRLLAEEVDPRRTARRRLVSALLLGGNVTVREGRDRGGDFRRIRACRSARQLGCVVAYSAFNAPVPEGAIFGRTSTPGMEILCTNPAALAGGAGRLDPIYPRRPFAPSVIGAVTNGTLEPLPRPATPWAALPGSYSARCSEAHGADVLRVSPRRGAVELSASPTAEWGLHLGDVNLALGNLTDVVRRQIRGWVARRG